jgi:hypothetical protein
MRKLTMAAAAMTVAALCTGNAFALTGGYANGAQAPASGVVKVGCCCHRRVHRCGCCVRHCWVPSFIGCGCSCGCWFTS